jgi:hypothetical protein
MHRLLGRAGPGVRICRDAMLLNIQLAVTKRRQTRDEKRTTRVNDWAARSFLQCTHERAIDGQACLRLKKGTVLNGFFKGVNVPCEASLRMVKRWAASCVCTLYRTAASGARKYTFTQRAHCRNPGASYEAWSVIRPCVALDTKCPQGWRFQEKCSTTYTHDLELHCTTARIYLDQPVFDCSTLAAVKTTQ